MGQVETTKVYVLVHHASQDETHVLAAFSDPDEAEAVRSRVGWGGRVLPLDVNAMVGATWGPSWNAFAADGEVWGHEEPEDALRRPGETHRVDAGIRGESSMVTSFVSAGHALGVARGLAGSGPS